MDNQLAATHHRRLVSELSHAVYRFGLDEQLHGLPSLRTALFELFLH